MGIGFYKLFNNQFLINELFYSLLFDKMQFPYFKPKQGRAKKRLHEQQKH
jgi:hypothetical protein